VRLEIIYYYDIEIIGVTTLKLWDIKYCFRDEHGYAGHLQIVPAF
jgi:hypothetical protein